MVLINNRLAKDAGVIGPNAKKPAFGLFGTAGQFDIKSLELGGLKAENVKSVVMDHPTVGSRKRALKPDFGEAFNAAGDRRHDLGPAIRTGSPDGACAGTDWAGPF